MESTLNYGLRKEMLYTSSQFTELFYRFLISLKQNSLLVVAGYSFQDDRINEFLREAVCRDDRPLRLLIVDPDRYWLTRRVPFISAAEEFGLVSFIDKRLGEALKNDALISHCRSYLDGPLDPNGKAKIYKIREKSDSVDTAATPVLEFEEKSRRLCNSWQKLDIKLDLLSFNVHQLAGSFDHYSDKLDASDCRKLIIFLKPTLRCARDVHWELSEVYKGLGFGALYDDTKLRNCPIRALSVKNALTKQGLRKKLDEVLTWFGAAHGKYQGMKEEFVQGVTDPDWGKSTNAPSNFHLAELMLRGFVSKLEDAGCALNDLLEYAGCGRPISFDWDKRAPK